MLKNINVPYGWFCEHAEQLKEPFHNSCLLFISNLSSAKINVFRCNLEGDNKLLKTGLFVVGEGSEFPSLNFYPVSFSHIPFHSENPYFPCTQNNMLPNNRLII